MKRPTRNITPPAKVTTPEAPRIVAACAPPERWRAEALAAGASEAEADAWQVFGEVMREDMAELVAMFRDAFA